MQLAAAEMQLASDCYASCAIICTCNCSTLCGLRVDGQRASAQCLSVAHARLAAELKCLPCSCRLLNCGLPHTSGTLQSSNHMPKCFLILGRLADAAAALEAAAAGTAAASVAAAWANAARARCNAEQAARLLQAHATALATVSM